MLRGPGQGHSPRPPRLTSQRDKDIIPRRLRHNADQGRDTVPVLSPSSRPLRIIPFSLLPSLAGTAQIFFRFFDEERGIAEKTRAKLSEIHEFQLFVRKLV